MISEIRVVTVGVADLAASRAFYGGCFDYGVLGEGTASKAELTELWGGSKSMNGTQVLMGPRGATSGLLRLVQVDQPALLYWGDYSRMQDYGHYALNIRVPEITDAIQAIQEHGGRTRSGPTRWTVTSDLEAWDSLSYDPDGILMDVFQIMAAPTSPLAEYDSRPSPLQTVAIHSSDARRSARFYAALGMRPMYDKTLRDMEEFFHLPKGTDLHNINMMHPDAPGVGRMEIAQYVGFPGVSQRGTAVAGSLGILSAAFETTNFEATEMLLVAIGAEPAGAAIEVQQPGIGWVRARCWFGPDGERLEFYERN